MHFKIAIVGEAWGEKEEQLRMPFVGAGGYLLDQLLLDAGISKRECFLTNVFNLRPRPTNDVNNLCGSRKEVRNSLGPLAPGKYLRDEYLPELERLFGELAGVAPNLIIALGGTASWALLGNGSISGVRGSISYGINQAAQWKVLPTYHPNAILREYSYRAIAIADLMKAAREAEFPEVRRPERYIWIDPTLTDLERFYAQYIQPSDEIAVDIETRSEAITCIGFAPSIREALVVPFEDPRKPGWSYWPTHSEEYTAWEFVRKVCEGPKRKIFQNGLYDLRFLFEKYGIATANCADDTMLAHHALYPEQKKGLAFLGSIYTNEASWKLMRDKWTKTIKKEE
jgi:uracil-DNA glycosylase